MHVDFDPSKIEWAEAYKQFPTKTFQIGGYSVFRGLPYQRGNGLGSVFRHLFRYLLPIGKEIGAAIGHQGLETGNRVLSKVLKGEDLKQSLIDEGQTGLKTLLEKAATKLGKEEKAQTGRGGFFDFKSLQNNNRKVKKRINRMHSTIGPPDFIPSSNIKLGKRKRKIKSLKPNIKRLRIDTLGTY